MCFREFDSLTFGGRSFGVVIVHHHQCHGQNLDLGICE